MFNYILQTETTKEPKKYINSLLQKKKKKIGTNAYENKIFLPDVSTAIQSVKSSACVDLCFKNCWSGNCKSTYGDPP